MVYVPPVDPDPREERLPRWARDLLDNMRMRVRRAEADAEAALLATNAEGSDTQIYRFTDEPVGLGIGPTIEFRLGDRNRRDYVHCRVETHPRAGTRLEVIGGDALRIAPKSGNHITITTKE